MSYLLFDHLSLILLIIGVVFAIGTALGRLSRFIGVPAGLFFWGMGDIGWLSWARGNTFS